MKRIIFAALLLILTAAAQAQVKQPDPKSFGVILVALADETQEFHLCEDCRVFKKNGTFKLVDVGDDNHVFFEAKLKKGEDDVYVIADGTEYSVFIDPNIIIIVNDNEYIRVLRTW